MASERRWIVRAGGIASGLVAALLVVGVAGLLLGAPIARPWLAVLLGINAGLGRVSLDTLEAVHPIDIAVLLLAGVAFSAFWPGPGKPHRGWLSLAIGLPLAGIVVLVATGLWGRSGLMGGGLVLSILMLGDASHRPLGYLGIAANLLLLIGDFSTVGRSLPIACMSR